MYKINTLTDLMAIRDKAILEKRMIEDISSPDQKIQIKVAMATCGIASGASEVKDFLSSALQKRGFDAVVTQTGCMGYCYAEPTIEVNVPGRKSVIFGYVDLTKADQIIEKYIKNNELPEGVIDMNYRTIDE